MTTIKYRWQAPGNGKIFDKSLGEQSYMNSRSIGVLKYIYKHKKVSQAQFEREIKLYLQESTVYVENKSTPAHFFRPLLFLGFIKMSKSKIIELTLEGDKFLLHYENKNYRQCKKYILNQLDNSKYPNIATKDVKVQLYPFRILFKLLLESNDGIDADFIKTRLVYIESIDDLSKYIKSKNLNDIQQYDSYDKFYTWVINSLVNIEVLKKENKNYFIADDIYDNVQTLYENLEYSDLFFNEDTLLCEIDNKISKDRYKRDARLIKEAKERDKYRCILDSKHTTFISKGHNYVEGHHVIPMFHQKNYSFELDDIDNIISLCPNCHREIHSADDKEKILTKVYNVNEKYMQANNIALEELYKMYFCS
jgi:5-methylcytosine-specific restriction protein A